MKLELNLGKNLTTFFRKYADSTRESEDETNEDVAKWILWRTLSIEFGISDEILRMLKEADELKTY